MIYFITLSESWLMYCQMVKRRRTNWKGFGNKELIPNEASSQHLPGDTKNNKEKNQDNRHPSQNTNCALLNKSSRVLTPHQPIQVVKHLSHSNVITK